MGGLASQGRAFGWLEGGRGASAAVLGTVSLFVFSNFSSETTSLAQFSAERINAFKNVILFTSAFTIFSTALVWWFVPNNKESRPVDTIRLSQITRLLKIPSLWLLAIIIICAYVGYKITDDFSLYAHEVLGYSEFQSAGIGTGALWMRALVAVLAGYMADKVKPSKIINLCFALSFTAAAMIALGFLEQLAVLVILNLALVMIGVYGVRALYFALIQEARIPVFYTGTAVGIVSVLGFTPDIFMSPWMGYLLDNYPGAAGHHKVFWVLSLFAALGFLASFAFVRINKTKQ